LVTIQVKAQTTAFDKIDTADLKLTSCDFERNANAMILFDKAEASYHYATIVMHRYKRIKIFNDNGKDEANIRIEFYGGHRNETITDIVAQTINLNGKSVEYTAVDKTQIYKEEVDKDRKAFVFTFPKVKAGSVVEFRYTFSTPYPYNFPDWYFESEVPTRYSELDANFSSEYRLDILKTIYQPMLKDTLMLIGKKTNPKGFRYLWAMSNIRTYKEEPYIDYPKDYLQRIEFRGPLSRYPLWAFIGNEILQDEDFGGQLNIKLSAEDSIINKANRLKSLNEKVAFIFDTVKRSMSWNKKDRWFTVDGVKKAWSKKTGNSTEINLILYHLLKEAGINTSLAVLKNRRNGRMVSNYPTFEGLNKTVVYCPIDTPGYYILDASNPYNSFNNIPAPFNGLNVLYIDPESKTSRLLVLKGGTTKEAVTIEGNIDAQGKLKGKLQISSTNYNREKHSREYKELGEKQYINQLERENMGLKITSLKLENLAKDTLPLNQMIEFNCTLAEPDNDYLYFNPNKFTGFGNNPFLSETRISDIEIGGLFDYYIDARYSIPPGYKVSVLPKSITLIMHDKSIKFKRILAEQNGVIITYYIINLTKSSFSKDEYPPLHEFYAKMYEMLNEQIVLKKR